MWIFNRGLDDEAFSFDVENFNFVPEAIYIDGDVVGFNWNQLGHMPKNFFLEDGDTNWGNFSWIFGKWFLPTPLTLRLKSLEYSKELVEERPDIITLLVTCYNYKHGKVEGQRLHKLVFRANDGLKLTNHSIVTDYFEFLTCDFYDSEVGQFVEGIDWFPMTFEQFLKRCKLKSKILEGDSLK